MDMPKLDMPDLGINLDASSQSILLLCEGFNINDAATRQHSSPISISVPSRTLTPEGAWGKHAVLDLLVTKIRVAPLNWFSESNHSRHNLEFSRSALCGKFHTSAGCTSYFNRSLVVGCWIPSKGNKSSQIGVASSPTCALRVSSRLTHYRLRRLLFS